ncbi:hypothetical protein AVEN_26690-1 [Araneus ventricosus]|uniref:Uncharacterized protein n=1 Tax=Araneus ventricosus TaxID=182803 RepID=A0A4Y2RK79_ARAVE|nr:hypothetical protein AVEN_26690-1 [Araneus ventricosus]
MLCNMESGLEFNYNNNSHPTTSSIVGNSSSLNGRQILPGEITFGKNDRYGSSRQLSHQLYGNAPSVFQGLNFLDQNIFEYEATLSGGTHQQNCRMSSRGNKDAYSVSHQPTVNEFSVIQSRSSESPRYNSTKRLQYVTSPYLFSVCGSNEIENPNLLSQQQPRIDRNVINDSRPYKRQRLGSVSVKIEGLYSPTKLIRKEFRTNGVLHQQSGKTKDSEMNHELSENDSNKQRFTDSLARQPHEAEFCMGQDFYSKPQQTSENGSSAIQEANLHEDESTKSPSSHSFPNNSSAKGYLTNKDSYTLARITSNSGVNMHPGLQSKDIHIFVVEPGDCGTIRLIKTFATNSQLGSPNRFGLPFKKNIIMRGISFTVNVWHMQELIDNTEDLKTCFKFSRSMLVPVYDVAEKSCIFKISRLILVMKETISDSIPVYLVGNTSDVRNKSAVNASNKKGNRFISFDYGIYLKEKYGLLAFRELSIESVTEVDALFLDIINRTFKHKL